MKTLFVVEVASSNRSAELAVIAREDINFRSDCIVLFLRKNFIVKNEGKGHTPSTIEIPSLPGSRLGPNKAVTVGNDQTR